MRYAAAALLALLALGAASASADPGDLDRTYGGDGRATGSLSDWRLTNAIADLAVDRKGGAVVGITMWRLHKGSFQQDPLIFAFRPDGRPDRTFSDDGRMVLPTPERDLEVRIARQRGGGILVATYSRTTSELIGMRPSGRVARSFGNRGRVSLGLDELADLAVAEDGAIVVAGTDAIPGDRGNPDFAAIRLTAAGARDASFGAGGVATIDFRREEDARSSLDTARGLVTRPGGGLILSGTSLSADGLRGGVVLAALRADGTLDPGFRDGGRLFADPEAGGTRPRDASGGGESVAIGPGGEIVFGGTVRGNFTTSVLSPFGSPDPLFAGDGTVVVDVSRSDDADSLAVAPDGAIYLAGSIPGRESRDYAVVRLLSSGQQDLGFGRSGTSVIDFGGDYDDADAVVARPNGKVLVSGTVGDDGIGVVRLFGG